MGTMIVPQDGGGPPWGGQGALEVQDWKHVHSQPDMHNYDRMRKKHLVCFPDRHSVNANVKEAAKSIVIGLGIKCVWYSMSREDIYCNIASMIRELEFKNYLKSWWRGHLFMAVERSGQLLGAQVACLLRDYTGPR